MQQKLKECKKCGKRVRYYKNQTCLPCFKLEHPEQFQIKKSSKQITKKPIKQTKKTWVKKQSERGIARVKKYQKLRDTYIKLHPVCEFPGCTSKDVQLHHKKGRDGTNMFKHFMSCCDKHHKYIHLHPEESFEKGWLLSRIKINKNES